MKAKLIVLFLILLLVLSFSCSKAEIEAKGHSVLCMTFLSKDENRNAQVITEVTKLKQSWQHQMHLIVFTAESQQDKVAQEIINKYSINRFPAITVDGNLLAEGQSLEQACRQASKRKTIIAQQHLATDIIDGQTLVAMFYVCCFEKGESIENGRVMLYVIEESKSGPDRYLPVFKTVIADSQNYYVQSGSCHSPETVYWEIPEDLEPKNLQVVMVIYENGGKILATCCSTEDCTEKAKAE